MEAYRAGALQVRATRYRSDQHHLMRTPAQAGVRALSTRSAYQKENFSSNSDVVVLAYASNPFSLPGVDWGEVTLGDDGFFMFDSMESVVDVGSSLLMAVEPSGEEGFSEGPIPRCRPGVQGEEMCDAA